MVGEQVHRLLDSRLKMQSKTTINFHPLECIMLLVKLDTEASFAQCNRSSCDLNSGYQITSPLLDPATNPTRVAFSSPCIKGECLQAQTRQQGDISYFSLFQFFSYNIQMEHNLFSAARCTKYSYPLNSYSRKMLSQLVTQS